LENLSLCTVCNRLYRREPGRPCCERWVDLCDQVDYATEVLKCRSVGAIVRATGLPVERVRDIVSASALLRHEVAIETKCVYCGKPTTPDCVDCAVYRAELRAEVEIAREKTREKIEPKVRPRVYGKAGRMSVGEALEEKRARASTNRVDLDRHGRR
jgi:hypothetical protein